MKMLLIFGMALLASSPLFATAEQELGQSIQSLKFKLEQLAQQVKQLKRAKTQETKKKSGVTSTSTKQAFHRSTLKIYTPNHHPESLEFYPTALIADEEVVTYIAGTPVVTSPYLGARPAFDGSDYIVNISSINRDIRLMQQRRNLYRGYQDIGYPSPDVPIITLSGKIEPVVSTGRNYFKKLTTDVSLGSNELDVAAILNENVEAYMGLVYDATPFNVGSTRVANSRFNLNMGFVNIGNLDKTPFYFTMGQIYVPFGRYSTSMISSTLPMMLSRTRSRPVIFGYKSQKNTGPVISLYGFKGDTTYQSSAVGGVNATYIFALKDGSGEIGASLISSMNNAAGMQYTGSVPNTTFGGFGSLTNGSENVKPIPAVDVHANVSIGRYSFMGEWVFVTERFRVQDLSYGPVGAAPQALQAEADVTFDLWNKPASLGAAYNWTTQAVALNLPKQRLSGVFNISIWKDTVESLEYRHDIDYKTTQYGNGVHAPTFQTNQNTYGTGKSADLLVAQIGVYF